MKKTKQTLYGSHAMCVFVWYLKLSSLGHPSVSKARRDGKRSNGKRCTMWIQAKAGPNARLLENVGWREKSSVVRWNSLKWKWAEKNLIANWINVTAWISYLQRMILCGGNGALRSRFNCLKFMNMMSNVCVSVRLCGQTIETKQNVNSLFSAQKISLSCLSCRIVYALSVHFGHPFDCH